MRDKNTTIRLLRDAEVALAAALLGLDDSATPCGSCGVRVYAAFDEHQMAEALRGALGRCRRVRLNIESKLAADARPKGGA